MRKFLSVLLMLCLIAGMLPMAALAGNTTNCSAGDSCTHEAAIDSTHYDTIGEAIDAANRTSGSGTITIKLLKNATLTGGELDSVGKYYTVKRILKNITLDLGEYTLKYNENGGFAVDPNCHFTIQNGTYINTSTDDYAQAIEGTKRAYDGPGCTITIAKDAVIQATWGICADGHTTINVYGKIISTKDGIFGSGPKNNVTLDGAYIEAGIYGVYQQGKDGGSTYKIKNSTITTPSDTDSCAVFIANNKESAEDTDKQGMQTLIIENSSISGQDGIEVRYTNVTISGDKTEVTSANDGFALGVTHNGSESAVGTLSITGGTFKGVIGFMDGENDTATLTISGGTFLTSDGSANEDVKTYIQSGLTQDDSGKIIVDPKTAVAKIGDVNYLTLTDALDEAKSDDTVVLLQDAELSQAIDSGVILEVPKDVTLTINDLTTVAGSEGKLKVDAGGTLDVGGTNMIGGDDANINLTEGYIDISIESSALKLDFVDATAEIPSGKRWTLLLASNYNMNVTLDKDTTLTVNSTGDSTNDEDGFRVANDSTLNNNGKVVVNGVMSISSQGKVEGSGSIEIGSKGVLEVKAAGTDVGTLENNVTNKGTFVWNGADATSPTGTITLGSSGKVYSQADLSNKLGGSISGTSNKTYNGKTYAYAWEYYVAPTTPTTPTEPEEPEKDSWPFVDVAEGAWYYEAVKYVYENGLMIGTSDDTFSPNATLSRAMVAQILYNLEGKPDVATEDSFTDAAGAGQWAVKAIAWAKQTGVVSGYEDGTFRPSNAVSREELAQMLYNYAQYKQIILPAVGDLSKFPDGEEVSSWAETAMSWATGLGVINGYEDETLRPGGSTTRAEAASMIKGVAETLTK